MDPSRSAPTTGCLVNSINQLLLNGEPDASRRKAALDVLVNDVLTPYEVLYLHNALSRRRPELAHHFATLDKLPPELINLIAAHLDLLDVASCVQVNNGWNALWTSKFVVHGMLHQFFPGLLQTTRAKGAMPDDAWVLFQQAARKRWRFQCGTQCTRRTFPKSCLLGNIFSNTHSEQIRDSEPLYCAGRVVWQKDSRHFVIDNLHNMDRHVLNWHQGMLSGYEVRLLAITQKLVVLTGVSLTGASRASRMPALIVYHFDEKRFLKVALPASIDSLYADDLKIGLHLQGSLGDRAPATSMYIWQWNGPLQLVEPSQATLERVSEPRDILPRGFLFHPFEKDVFSAVWTIRNPPGESGKITVLVDEYKDDEPLLHTHHSHIEWWMPSAKFCIGMQHLGPDWCQETDSYGGYDVCQVRKSTWDHAQQVNNEFFRFNTVTRSFVIRNKGGADCFPDDTLRTPWIDAAQVGPGSESTMLAVETPQKALCPLHNPYQMPLEHRGCVAFTFNAPGGGGLNGESGPTMACDDEFMVIRDEKGYLFHGYTVWGYGRTLRQSTGGV
ncbi:hypothetical protein F5X68DRAFT_205753 [Plectosphaerella plurivora]|uniref:F-box domain-containing protein n=1 Tax=Plectosphaerella plurivora TaxID=936078 RepID=A0A9P9A9A0_9PEZI|nr:hypothetical protein F5X68DRAFT_205753 [Plectosphaerella plurivora]